MSPTVLDVLSRGRPFPTPRPTARQLPYDDGEPMESRWHLENMNLLLDSIDTRWSHRDDFYAGGNMFVYFGEREVFNKDFRGPDFFVVSGGVDRHKERPSWVMWEENDRLPDVIVELMSPSTAEVDRVVKHAVYANRMHCREYFIYDPAEDRLQGWQLGPGSEYLPLDFDDNDRLRSDVLGCTHGTWDGDYHDMTGRWLRMFEEDGRLAPTRLEVARGRLEATQARLASTKAKLTASEARFAAERAARKAADDELARLRAELAALRGTPPTTDPTGHP